MRNKPRIRFKGFTEDWEQYKLEDICLYQSSSVTINDVDENGRYDLYDVNSLIGKTNKGFMEKEYITIIKDGAGVGRTRILPKNSMFLGTMGAITPQNSNLEFLYQLVTSANLGKICSGSTIPHIYFKDYGKLKFYIPSIIEQEVIGKIFYNIDNLITLHQRKLEKLKLAKKALLQKLFPKNGSQFPEIRFKGFTDAWEQCKLGDLLILLKDGSHGTHKNTSEGVYLLSAKNIKNGRINIMPDDRIISWDDYNVIHKNYELQSGDILLTIVGSIGETAIYNLKTKVTFQRSVAFLRPNLKLKNGFLYTLMNTDRFQNQLQTKQVVSAQPGIYLGDLASINITYPKNVSEQEKIYNIFKGIEHSITLHQRKLERLQEVKKGLLQKMFV